MTPPTGVGGPSNHESSNKELTAGLNALARLMDERDRLYKERSDAQKEAVAAALAANKELTNNAFLASEKAIGKAETAQTDYNLRSNEFRQALDDSNKDKLSRAEADTRFGVLEEKFSEYKRDAEVYRAGVGTEIRALREARSAELGAAVSTERRVTQTNFTISHAIALVGLLLSAAIVVAKFLSR